MTQKSRLYSYVGPQAIIDSVDLTLVGKKIAHIRDIEEWLKFTEQNVLIENVIVTFVITENNELLINDRHSEHVMCAGGKKVKSAGEITFSIENKVIYITEISNQSTGYCPEPESWRAVEHVLRYISIEYPSYFTNVFEFRFCEKCQSINLIKEEVFECAICEETLDLKWNFDK